MSDLLLIARYHQGATVYTGHKSTPCQAANRLSEFATCTGVKFSSDGSFLALLSQSSVSVVRVADWTCVCSLSLPNAQDIVFSPCLSYIFVWRYYTTHVTSVQQNLHQEARQVSDETDTCNVFLYELSTGICLRRWVHKQFDTWRPRMSQKLVDMYALMARNEIQFLSLSTASSQCLHALRLQSVAGFELSPTQSARRDVYVSVFVPVIKNAPGTIYVFKFPSFSEMDYMVKRNVFKADRADMRWNNSGNFCLFLLSTDHDSTGRSYYGTSSLFLLGIDGEANQIHSDNGGSVHSIDWDPSGRHFCVIHGFMPSKTTIFNCKREEVFNFTSDYRNLVLYNPYGNLMLLVGLGNIQGALEIYDARSRQLLAKQTLEAATHVSWCPDGRHLSVSTCAPRMRQDTGFVIYDYLLHATATVRVAAQQKHATAGGGAASGAGLLHAVCWQPNPLLTAKLGPPKLPQTGLSPLVTEPSNKYVPPFMRGAPAIPGLSVAPQTKKAAKQKRITSAATTTNVSMVTTVSKQKPTGVSDSVADLERKRKIDGLKKKLKEINKLKSRANGEPLDKNQLEKLSREKSLQAELEALKL